MAQRSTRRDRENQIMDTRFERLRAREIELDPFREPTRAEDVTAASEAGHMSAPDHARALERFFLHPTGASTHDP